MEPCSLCNQTQCCPEHCCDWDSCRCGDCSACGGFDKPVPIQSVSHGIGTEETNKMSDSNNIVPTEENIRVLEEVSTITSRISNLDIQSTAPTDSGAFREFNTISEIIDIERRVEERIKKRKEEEAKVEQEKEEVRKKERERHVIFI